MERLTKRAWKTEEGQDTQRVCVERLTKRAWKTEEGQDTENVCGETDKESMEDRRGTGHRECVWRD